VISSTQAAIDQGKNTFKSTTLTQNDIDNHASYDANSISVSAGTGGPLGGSAGVGHDSGNASSVTQSGISGIAGNRTARTGDAETGINKVFDATKVQSESGAQTQITQAFGSQASKAIGDYATAQEAKAQALRDQAKQTTDLKQQQNLNAQADQIDSKWGDQGTLRLGAHAIVGGLTGGISGAVGVTAGALTAPEVAKALTAAHITGPLASTLTALASTAVGVAAGGTAGGATAYNEVNNNYLTHQNISDLTKALDKCKGDKACATDVYKQAIADSKYNNSKIDACSDDSVCLQGFATELASLQGQDTKLLKQLSDLTGKPSSTVPKLSVDATIDKYGLYKAVDVAKWSATNCSSTPAMCQAAYSKMQSDSSAKQTMLLGGMLLASLAVALTPELIATTRLAVANCTAILSYCLSQVGMHVADFVVADAVGGVSIVGAGSIGAKTLSKLEQEAVATAKVEAEKAALARIR
jgi:hypothetical protein